MINTFKSNQPKMVNIINSNQLKMINTLKSIKNGNTLPNSYQSLLRYTLFPQTCMVYINILLKYTFSFTPVF